MWGVLGLIKGNRINSRCLHISGVKVWDEKLVASSPAIVSPSSPLHTPIKFLEAGFGCGRLLQDEVMHLNYFFVFSRVSALHMHILNTIGSCYLFCVCELSGHLEVLVAVGSYSYDNQDASICHK